MFNDAPFLEGRSGIEPFCGRNFHPNAGPADFCRSVKVAAAAQKSDLHRWHSVCRKRRSWQNSWSCSLQKWPVSADFV